MFSVVVYTHAVLCCILIGYSIYKGRNIMQECRRTEGS